MKSREFADTYAVAKAEVAATDKIMRLLDKERVDAHVTKADIARRAGMPPETVRKLFTAEGVNPTMRTVNRLAAVLGFRLVLVKVTL